MVTPHIEKLRRRLGIHPTPHSMYQPLPPPTAHAPPSSPPQQTSYTGPFAAWVHRAQSAHQQLQAFLSRYAEPPHTGIGRIGAWALAQERYYCKRAAILGCLIGIGLALYFELVVGQRREPGALFFGGPILGLIYGYMIAAIVIFYIRAFTTYWRITLGVLGATGAIIMVINGVMALPR